MALKRCIALASLSILVAATAPASAGQLLDDSSAGWPPIWSAGATVSISPEYEGSDEYKVTAIPYVFPSFGLAASRIEVRGADDVRFKVLREDRFELGPLAGYRFDREEGDGPKLAGLGDVDGGLVVGGFMRAALLPSLYAGVSYHRTVTGDVDGGQLRFGLEYETKPTYSVSVFARAGATYADDAYMDAYFGVTSAQQGTSGAGLQAFDADAGIKDVYATLGAQIQLAERWKLNLKGQYTRLVGDAADSPVIETEDQFSGSAGIIYRFGPRKSSAN